MRTSSESNPVPEGSAGRRSYAVHHRTRRPSDRPKLRNELFQPPRGQVNAVEQRPTRTTRLGRAQGQAGNRGFVRLDGLSPGVGVLLEFAGYSAVPWAGDVKRRGPARTRIRGAVRCRKSALCECGTRRSRAGTNTRLSASTEEPRRTRIHGQRVHCASQPGGPRQGDEARLTREGSFLG